MTYRELAKIVSKPRLDRYLQAADGDKVKAVKLYSASGLLNIMLFSFTSCFEVALRNKINDHISQTNTDWLIKLSYPGSAFDKQNTIHSYNSLVEARYRLISQGKFCNDQMVDSMSIGFWASLFLRNQHNALGGDLVLIFDVKHPNLLHTVQRNINQLRRLRNEIAHNSPTIFKPGTNEVNFERIDLFVGRAIELTEWMGITPTIYDDSLALIGEKKQAIREILI